MGKNSGTCFKFLQQFAKNVSIKRISFTLLFRHQNFVNLKIFADKMTNEGINSSRLLIILIKGTKAHLLADDIINTDSH